MLWPSDVALIPPSPHLLAAGCGAAVLRARCDPVVRYYMPCTGVGWQQLHRPVLCCVCWPAGSASTGVYCACWLAAPCCAALVIVGRLVVLERSSATAVPCAGQQWHGTLHMTVAWPVLRCACGLAAPCRRNVALVDVSNRSALRRPVAGSDMVCVMWQLHQPVLRCACWLAAPCCAVPPLACGRPPQRWPGRSLVGMSDRSALC